MNHKYIRYVLPRGKSFSPYTQEDIILLLNHINSTRRSKLGGKTPFELADGEEFLKLKEVMGLKAIPADEVDRTPRLLKKVSNNWPRYVIGLAHFFMNVMKAMISGLITSFWNGLTLKRNSLMSASQGWKRKICYQM